MTTAIVTITCPQCGGKVEGVAQTGAEQTVPCAYCRTELHVPRVGEVVRERVIERVVERAIAADAPVRRTTSPLATVSLLAVGLAVACLTVRVIGSESDEEVAVFEQQRASENACEAGCPAQCDATLAGKSYADVTIPGEPGLRDSMREADKTVCVSGCQVKCMGIDLQGK